MDLIPTQGAGLPTISGYEGIATEHAGKVKDAFRTAGRIDFKSIKSAAAVALHMHQPLIPAGGHDLRSAEVISNLKHMFDNQGVGDNHNASTFYWCYKRMGEFIPKLVGEGKQPRVMLEYSGCLLDGLKKMGSDDLFSDLRNITTNPELRHCAEWLGCPWGHAVAPSTPVQDFRLHVLAWQQHFAALFGVEALERVKGFSPSEMALPNQPDVAYEFVKTLRECGFTWVIIQEHTVEQTNGHGVEKKHIPHRLVCTSSTGETASIVALLKTQGSDTKLVGQMQPWYEAQSLDRWTLKDRPIPPLVTQIADGENGGVMMNEFPPKYIEVVNHSSGGPVPLMNGSEYLEHLYAAGFSEADFPVVQPIHQKKIWDRMKPGDGPSKVAKVIEEVKKEDHRFHMEGGSWTNNISWVRGYEHVLGPIDKVSRLFAERVTEKGIKPTDPRYRNAVYYLLLTQTSCFRYWGDGIWTDYAKELCRRAEEVLKRDF